MHNEPSLAKCNWDVQPQFVRFKLTILGSLWTVWNGTQALGFCALPRRIRLLA